MYQVVQGVADSQSDAAAFIESLNNVGEQSVPAVQRLFDKEAELVVTRAPGRLDVMGGIADYSGSLVLELPIQEATFVALQRDSERMLKIVSLSEDSMPELTFDMSLSEFEGPDGPIDSGEARTYFQRDPTRHWAAYVAGVFLVLERERGIHFPEGARILI